MALAALALASAYAPLLPPASAGEDDGATLPTVVYEWWGPTDASGWHFRFPVLVEPRYRDTLTRFGETGELRLGDTPVQLEVDLSQMLRDTNLVEGAPGWPMDEFGRLSSFTFDPSTIRVVSYDRASGRVEANTGRGGAVPHAFVTTLLDNAEGRSPVFNASQNAVGTLQWIVPDPFNAPLLYFVYFDTKENGAKPAAGWTEADLAPIRALHFVRAGHEFYGYLPAGASMPKGHVFVYAIYSNTTISIQRYRYPGFPPDEVPPCAKRGAIGMCVTGGTYDAAFDPDHVNVQRGLFAGGGRALAQVQTTNEPLNEPFYFRVVATKPVIAAVQPDTPGPTTYQTSFWVPSVDGALLGSQFYVPTTNAPHVDSGLVLIGGATDAFVSIGVDSGGGAFKNLRAGDVERFEGYGGGTIVRVFSSADIMVASLPHGVTHGNQAVSQLGTPVGDRLFAMPTISTSLSIIPHADAAVSFFDLEDPTTTYPPGGPHPIAAGPGNAWVPAASTFRSTDPKVWQFKAESGQISAIYGDRGFFPVGGLDARDFSLVLRSHPGSLNPVTGRAFVMPLYPQTRVDVERWDDTRERYVSVAQKVVSPDAYLTQRPGTAEPLMEGSDGAGGRPEPGAYRVRATKPVAVYHYAELDGGDRNQRWPYQTFLVGRAYSPVTVLGPVEFYGPLVSWKTKVVQETVKPGDQVVATFEVQNLGRTADGRALTDSVSIATRTPRGAPTWTTRLSTAFEADLPGGQTRSITVVVDVPKDAKTGEALDLSLVASSETNPAMGDTAVLQITVQTRYDIEMAFRANNRPQLQSVVDPGVTRDFLVRVKNVGSGADGVSFTMLRANPFGFEADVCLVDAAGSCESFLDAQGLSRIGVDGRPAALQLQANEERDVVLRVTAPRTSDPAQHNFVLEGTSTSDSSSRKQLTLTVLTNSKTALRIRALNDTFDVAPGHPSVLPVEVVNEGVETVVEMRLRAAQLPGWDLALDPPTFELRAPGAVDPRDGKALDRRIVNLTVQAGDGAPVGFLMPIEVVAASAVRAGDAEAPDARVLVTAKVVNNFTIRIPELLERSVLPGASVTYTVDLESAANGNVTLAPVATRLPPGWSLADADPPLVRLAPGERATLELHLDTRPNEAAGLYQGDFGFVLDDGSGRRAVATAPFALRVKRHVDFEAVPDGDFVVPPGGTTRAAFTLTNTGNSNASIELSVEAPPGWRAELVDSRQAVVELAPGDTTGVDVRVSAPNATADDAAEFALLGNVPLERERSTLFNVTVLRDDLVVTSVEALTSRFRVGDPVVFQATVVNRGTVPRTNVEVALVVDGDVARNVTVRSMPPGEERRVQIPWNVVPASTVSVQVDPRDAYHEEDEGNNVVAFDLDGARRLLPGAPVLVVLACAVAVGLLARRRRS